MQLLSLRLITFEKSNVVEIGQIVQCDKIPFIKPIDTIFSSSCHQGQFLEGFEIDCPFLRFGKCQSEL